MAEQFQVHNNKTHMNQNFGFTEEIRDMAYGTVFPFKNYSFSLCPQCNSMFCFNLKVFAVRPH